MTSCLSLLVYHYLYSSIYIYEVSSNGIDPDAVFTKGEINNECDVYSFQSNHYNISNYSVYLNSYI